MTVVTRSPRDLTSLAIPLCMALSLALAVLRFDAYQLGTYVDDAQYLILAESLATGRGYRLINFPDAPIEGTFPPGWPLLLAPWTVLAPGNYTLPRLLPLLFWLASIPLAYRLFAAHLGRRIAVPATALLALNSHLLFFATLPMSEMAYLFGSLLTLNLLTTWERMRCATSASPHWLLLAIAAVAVYTQLIRTVGLALILAVPLYLWLTRRRRAALVVGGVAALLLAPQAWLNWRATGGLFSAGYQAQVLGSALPDKLTQGWLNLQAYLGGLLADAVVPVLGERIVATLRGWGLGVIPLGVNVAVLAMLAGGAVLAWRRWPAAVLYSGLYFGAVLAFWNPAPGSAQQRFILPLVPFLYAYVLLALTWLAQKLFSGRPGWAGRSVGLATLLLACLLVGRNVQAWHSPVRTATKDLAVGTTWLAAHAAPDAVVMTRDPLPDYLYLRRLTVAYPPADEDVAGYLQRYGVDYVILAPKLQPVLTLELDAYTRTVLRPYLDAHPNCFDVIYAEPAHGVIVYRVRGSGECDQGGDFDHRARP